MSESSIGVATIGTESIASTPQVQSAAALAILVGREYRTWLEFPSEISDADLPIVDFIVARVPGSTLVLGMLPIGSLARARFYYGNTTTAFGTKDFTVAAATDVFTISAGHEFHDNEPVTLTDLTGAAGVSPLTTYFIVTSTATTFQLAATEDGTPINITTDGSGSVARVADPMFRPLWQYPVSVALAATPWHRWGAGNYWQNGVMSPDDSSLYGFANDTFQPHVRWSPAVGLMGEGTTILAMQLNDNDDLDMPFPTIIDRWFFHYSERGNVPQNMILQDVANGPINPYMVLDHQGRIVFPDRRRSLPAIATTSNAIDHGLSDDLLFYSDHLLPMQNFADPPLDSDKGQANADYGEFPKATMEPYNRQLVAEDIASGFGVIGVVTIDQILLVKHKGGGALISGDLDTPTHHRLPYIEPTRGVVCKGVATPIGFVYGSRHGIFAWQGGDTTQSLSPQLDGFFWNHADGGDEEIYAGQRGRMGYWNGWILVPNNYIYDPMNKSWWRWQMPELLPVSAADAPYNCYDVDEQGALYAFPYRHVAQQFESHAQWPADPTSGARQLSTPDDAAFSAPTQLDIRFALDDVSAGSTFIRSVANHGNISGSSALAFEVRLDATHHIQLRTSTTGSAFTATTSSDDPIITNATTNTPILGRVTWRSSDGRVQFFHKAAGDIEASLKNNNGWTQLGADETGDLAALFDSSQTLEIGAAATVTALTGKLFAFSLSVTIDADPVFAFYPVDITTSGASSFTATTGQTVTNEDTGDGPTLVHIDPDHAPVWYTYDEDILDFSYTWTSQPLLETRGRVLSFQAIELLASGLDLSEESATIAVTLTGINEAGLEITAPVTNFILSLNTTEPQILRADVVPNFLAEYVTVQIEASSGDVPAPKIHNIRFAVKERAKTPRLGT